mmetsp:Transcript_59774/g.111722  ORF Transcript_59774/g.111722 Transcript_59774/m.111722 type:complete len:230 (-) Transcript_59774:484-1173(-)
MPCDAQRRLCQTCEGRLLPSFDTGASMVAAWFWMPGCCVSSGGRGRVLGSVSQLACRCHRCDRRNCIGSTALAQVLGVLRLPLCSTILLLAAGGVRQSSRSSSRSAIHFSSHCWPEKRQNKSCSGPRAADGVTAGCRGFCQGGAACVLCSRRLCWRSSCAAASPAESPAAQNASSASLAETSASCSDTICSARATARLVLPFFGPAMRREMDCASRAASRALSDSPSCK